MKNINRFFKAAFILTLLMAAPKPTFAFHKYWCNYYCYCGRPCNCGYTQSTTPIDGGLGFLVAAGVAYGSKRYAKSRKQQKEKAETEA